MLDLRSSLPLGLRLIEMERLQPDITTRPATSLEVPLLQPWFAFGETDFDVAVFSDGTEQHAPATLCAARALLARAMGPVGLMYRHRGVQANPIDPLLPHLLAGLGHRGPVHALRAAEGAEPQPDAATLALLAAMTPPGASTILLDDHQSRVSPKGRLRPGTIHLSLFQMPSVQHSAGVQRP